MKDITSFINENKEIKHYVDAIIVNPDDELLLLQRAGYVKPFGGKWAFAGGSIDEKDKSPKDALIREIKEETGIELTFNEKHTMEYFDKEQHMGGTNDKEVVSDTEYFIVKLETKPEVKISREHARYKWFDKDSIKEKQGKCIPGVFHYIQRYYDK